jgi:tetratricopeptide (TPR) repeat protein
VTEATPDPRGDGARWALARAHFLELADATVEDRRAGLARLGAADPELCRWVERLLVQDTGHTPDDGPVSGEGQRVGPYLLRERLGEGGFGAVYLARQESPVERDVALKLLKPGVQSPQLLARFADERKYLARVDHPDVVKVLDAGVTADGRMYVAMELVRGEPITTFVERHRLPLAERVDLVARVARAVHHVHQRAIIHRDLKPTNILVSVEEGRARPRVIDFGIATAVSESDRAGWTRIAGPLCTPGYASPEQMVGSDRVDIRADVHALGVVLCEVLTGDLPRPRGAAPSTAPRPPSALVRARAIAPTAEAPVVTRRELSGDLDRIVLACVDEDPDARYDSAAAFADDLERHLRHEPVRAAPQRRLYLLGKFVRRNRFAVGAGGVALLAVLVGLALAVNGQRTAVAERKVADRAREAAALETTRARYEQARAEQSLADAVAAIDEMLRQGSADELAARPGADPARRALLLRALELYEGLLAREGGDLELTRRVVDAQIQVAKLRRELGEPEAALAAAQRALELCDAFADRSPDDPETGERRAEALYATVVALFDLGRVDAFRTAAAELLEMPPPADRGAALERLRARALTFLQLAQARQREGDVAGALAVLEDAMAAFEEFTLRRPEETTALTELAMALHLRGYYVGFYGREGDPDTDLARAVELLEGAQSAEPNAPWIEERLAKVLSNWAHVDLLRRRPADAVGRVRRADETLRRLCAEFPERESYLATYLQNALRNVWATSDGAEAEALLEVAVEAGRIGCARIPGSDSAALNLAILCSERAKRLDTRGASAEADVAWPEARAEWEALVARPEPYAPALAQVGVFYDNLARRQLVRKELPAAREAALRAAACHEQMLDRTRGREHATRLGQTLALLARIELGRGDPTAAVAALRRAAGRGALSTADLDLPIFDPLREREDFRGLAEQAVPAPPGG